MHESDSAIMVALGNQLGNYLEDIKTKREITKTGDTTYSVVNGEVPFALFNYWLVLESRKKLESTVIIQTKKADSAKQKYFNDYHSKCNEPGFMKNWFKMQDNKAKSGLSEQEKAFITYSEKLIITEINGK